MPKAAANGVELYYDSQGTGTAVIFVAGYGGVGGFWQPQMGPFARSYRAISFDHRGYGQSTHDTSIEYSLDQMADDVVALMDALEIDKAHFVGHSLGGIIGQNCALRHAARFHSMVWYASIPGADVWINRCNEMRVSILKNSGVRAFARTTPLFLYPDWWFNENQEWLAELEEKTVANFPPEYVIESRTRAIARYSSLADLHRVELPVLLMCARDDFLTQPYFTEHLSEKLPDAQVVWFERGGHAFSQTVPDEFNRTVLDFLQAQPVG